MSERPLPPELPDLFEKELDTRLKTWRASSPPPHLKTRIATEIQGPARIRDISGSVWRNALMVAACAVAVCVALLCLSLQPQPKFAKVEEAMKSVTYLSYRTQTDRMTQDGSVEHVTNEIWLRRNPSALAERISIDTDAKEPNQARRKVRLRKVTDAKHHITLDELTGARKVSVTSPKLDIARSVELHFYHFTHPGDDHPSIAALYHNEGTRILSPWQSSKDVLDGKPVWVFTSTGRTQGFKNTAGGKETTSTIRIWADASTYRVVRKESVSEFGNGEKPVRLLTTDFRYNASPPTGTFDLKLPKKVSPQKAK